MKSSRARFEGSKVCGGVKWVLLGFQRVSYNTVLYILSCRYINFEVAKSPQRFIPNILPTAISVCILSPCSECTWHKQGILDLEGALGKILGQGMPYHGEASSRQWQLVTSSSSAATLKAQLPMAGLEVERNVELMTCSVRLGSTFFGGKLLKAI